MIDEIEEDRLKAVSRYLMFNVKEEIQHIAKLASVIFKMPIALITLIDKEEQVILASEGVDLDRMPRITSFCNHAIKIEEVMMVEDASKDERFKDFPTVTGDYHIRFYASANLKSDNGFNIGTLCVYDVKPNCMSEEQKSHLSLLALQVERILELNRQLKLSVKKNEALAKIAWVYSHKIKGPLASIMGLVHLIKYDNYAFNPEYLAMLEKSANQLDEELKLVVDKARVN